MCPPTSTNSAPPTYGAFISVLLGHKKQVCCPYSTPFGHWNIPQHVPNSLPPQLAPPQVPWQTRWPSGQTRRSPNAGPRRRVSSEPCAEAHQCPGSFGKAFGLKSFLYIFAGVCWGKNGWCSGSLMFCFLFFFLRFFFLFWKKLFFPFHVCMNQCYQWRLLIYCQKLENFSDKNGCKSKKGI